jgi:hypothetical protein
MTDDDFLRAADELHRALARLVSTAPDWVLAEVDREIDDEDWVRDALGSMQKYLRWRATGESPWVYLAPGYDPGRACGDSMADAARYLAGGDDVDGWAVPSAVRADAQAALQAYESLRWREGGGGPYEGL